MNEPIEYSFQRYLSSKKSVDDRALNGPVWQRLHGMIADSEQPLRILEVGAGIGTMIERLVARETLGSAAYVAIDAEAANVAHALGRLTIWADQRGFQTHVGQGTNGHPTLKIVGDAAGNAVRLAIEFRTQDILELLADPTEIAQYDLLIAHAFLDLLDVERVLPKMAKLLTPEGAGYFTINFDGATILQPEIEAAYDAEIEALYHSTMDQRMIDGKPSGDSQTGRHLFGHLRASGYEIVEAGSSDWVVFAYADGYHEDEAYFLHFIVQTMHGALLDHPQINTEQFSRWITERHAQIERGDLVYVAHQLDFLVQRG